MKILRRMTFVQYYAAVAAAAAFEGSLLNNFPKFEFSVRVHSGQVARRV